MGAQHDFDIAFIGSGLSSTATLLKLIERLRSHAGSSPPRIAVIEKTGEFYSGIAYGDRSGPAALIITPLDEFLPAQERDPFIAWMTDHRDRLVEDLISEGGELSHSLAGRFKQALANGTAADIHVPRSFFGRYLAEKATTLLQEARDAGLVTCRLIHAEVTGLERIAGGYRIEMTENGRPISSRTVVLGLGTPPSRKLFSGVDDDARTDRLMTDRLIEDPYAPSITGNLAAMRDVLATENRESAPHILLIGANAACLELLYLLCDQDPVGRHQPTFHVLSPQGRMPECFVAVGKPSFRADALNDLTAREHVTAAAVLDAVKADLRTARAASLLIGETMPVISRIVGTLVNQKMSAREQQEFVNHVGVEIGRLQRRAGEEYSDIVTSLTETGRLHILAGRFESVAAGSDDRLQITYQETESGERKRLAQPIDLAINCSGSAGLARPNASALINSLLTSGRCVANGSSLGFKVDDRMRANDDLYVIGPMLAGNVVAGTPIWHVEHCGRIIDFSARLADQLLFGMRSDVAAA